MEELTIILFIATLLSFALSFKVQGRVLNTFVLVLAVCSVSAMLQDSTIADNQMYLAVFPLLAVALFAIANLVVIKEAK